MENLKEYIKNWTIIEGNKPCNEDLFINEFIDLITNLSDDRDVTFDGDGSYFGKQVTLHLNSGVWIGDPQLCCKYSSWISTAPSTSTSAGVAAATCAPPHGLALCPTAPFPATSRTSAGATRARTRSASTSSHGLVAR
jgi:hypothetical protein